MSVFHNIYTQKYEAAEQAREQIKSLTDFNFFDTCLTTVINTFKWKDYPDPKLPAFMVETFYQNAGRVAMYESDTGDLKVHPAFPAGQITDTGDFTSYEIVTPNGKTYHRDADDIVIGFNNCFRMPYVYKIAQFSDRMSYALRAVDSALSKACLPNIVLFEDESQLKKFDKFTNPEVINQPFVGMLKEKLLAKEVETLSLYEAGKVDVLALWDVYVRYRNLFYTTFGINNVEVQKRERLTEAEGAGNDEITRYSLLSDMYECRKDWCERCKEKFGSNITFEINRDITTVFELQTDNDTKIDLANLDFTKGTNPNTNPETSIEENESTEREIENNV